MSDVTEKVRKLLDQAQSTAFAEEADAFFAKAQKLISLHGISQAALQAAGTIQAGEIVSRSFKFEAPYAVGKLMIAWLIREPYHLEGLRTGRGKAQELTLFGTAANLDSFESMLNSVMLHATGELLAAKVPEWENTKSFRAAFLEGYGSSIRHVLNDASKEADNEASNNFTAEESKGVALVLLDEKDRVKQAMKKTYPHVTSGSRSSSRSYSGRGAGSGAAERFSGHRGNLGGSRKALT